MRTPPPPITPVMMKIEEECMNNDTIRLDICGVDSRPTPLTLDSVSESCSYLMISVDQHLEM